MLWVVSTYKHTHCIEILFALNR